MESNQVIRQVDDVGNLHLLLILKHVYRITSVTVRTRGRTRTQSRKIVVKSPTLREDSVHGWQLCAESCSFGHGTKVVGFSIQFSVSNNGGSVYEQQFVRLNGSQPAGKVKSVIPNLTIKDALRRKRKMPQLFYNGRPHHRN